jgi:proteasome lid subunit RPN8/RPN11
MVIARALLDDMIAHARDEYDAECCGMVAYERDGGERRAARVHRAKNVFAVDGGSAKAGGHSPAALADLGMRAKRVSPQSVPGLARKRFEIDGREVLGAMNDFEDADLELGAIYHSHTHTAPYPSQTDINFARNWPGVEWIIVGLAGDEPEIRCYLIEEGEVTEVPIEVQ